MKHDYTDEELIEQLRMIECPIQVDVVDRVMDEVEKRPMLLPKRNLNKGWRYAFGAAACIAALFVVNMTLMYTKDYDETAIGNMLAEVYYSDNQTMEIMAIDDDEITMEDYLFSEEL